MDFGSNERKLLTARAVGVPDGLDQIQIASGVSEFDAETISIKMRRDSLLKQIFGALTASSFTASPTKVASARCSGFSRGQASHGTLGQLDHLAGPLFQRSYYSAAIAFRFEEDLAICVSRLSAFFS
jgi:hypothetical protein